MRERGKTYKEDVYYSDWAQGFVKARWIYFVIFPFWYPFRFDKLAERIRRLEKSMFHVWLQRGIRNQSRYDKKEPHKA